MKTHKSLTYRIGAGNAIGLVFGLLVFFLMPAFVQDSSLLLRAGILLWYPTLGTIIALFGVFDRHPVFNFRVPWWFRGAIIGGWMNFAVTLIAYEQICAITSVAFGEYSVYVSPFWMVLEGVLFGVLMDYLLTRWFGEGWANASAHGQT